MRSKKYNPLLMATGRSLKMALPVLILMLCFQGVFAKSLFDKAYAAYDKKQYKKSIELYTKYLETHRDDKNAYFNRGLGYYELDDYEHALPDFQITVSMDPTYAKGYYQIASCQLVQKKYTESITNYTIAIGLKTDYQLAYSGRGLAKYYQKDYSGSVNDYDKALELDPTDWESYGSRGLSYHYLKLYSKALDDFNKCIAMNPKYQNAFTNRGLTEYELGNKSMACADWKTAAGLGSKVAADNLKDFCE